MWDDNITALYVLCASTMMMLINSKCYYVYQSSTACLLRLLTGQCY